MRIAPAIALVLPALFCGYTAAADELALPAASALSTAELDVQRGRQGLAGGLLQLGESSASATIEGNTLSSGSTGGNRVEAGAFADAAGIVFSVQNSGNHVIIQNSTVINVNVHP
ncbi:MAG TPA: hypothetical protein VF210_21710 [Pseudomonadales bacterium]